jgi:hypothetical protein
MRSARLLGSVAVILVTIGLGGWLSPVARAESDPPIMETGWWSRQPLAQPVADDGFAIGWSLEQEQSAAALRIDLAGDLRGIVYLQLHEVSGTASDQGLARVCVAGDRWEAANPGPYEDLPTSTCADGETADLGRDAGTLQWVADISALVGGADDTLSLVVHPVGKPLADGVPASAPFEVRFDSAALLVDPGPGAPVAAPTAGSVPPVSVDLGGSVVDPGLLDLDDPLGYEAPALPALAGPAPALATATTLGPTPDDLVALGPVDVTSAGGRPWGRLVALAPLSTGIGFAMAAARRWLLDRAAGH